MIDLDRLKANLLTSGIQQKNSALYQVINQLIIALRDLRAETVGLNSSSSETSLINSLIEATYLTDSDESSFLINSRQLLAGTGILFDDSIAGERTINVSPSGAGYWAPLTDGDPLEMDLISADGEVVMVFIPT